ncbi:MAG: hypothetical protein COB04_00210 [Gammaproteobacteria bacterium]|nr:MAG: hypothetical protein COB04_00210 [Gammaproteobacteria bacterium]
MTKLICDRSQRANKTSLKTVTNQCLLALFGRSLLSVIVRFSIPLLLTSGTAYAQGKALDEHQTTNQSSIIKPEIERNKINATSLNNTLIDSTAYVGLFKPQGFETQALTGIQIAIHPLDWIFVEANYGVSQINDDARVSAGFQTIIDDDQLEVLSAHIGIQVANSQLILNRPTPIALNASGFLSVGAGNIKISTSPQRSTEKLNTIVLGMGFKILLNQWLIIDSTVRDHISDSALLDKDSKGHNLEFRVGLGIHY